MAAISSYSSSAPYRSQMPRAASAATARRGDPCLPALRRQKRLDLVGRGADRRVRFGGRLQLYRWQSAASRVEATIAGGGEQERTELAPPLVARAGAPDLQEDVLRQIVTGRVVAQHLPAQRPDPVLVPPDDLAECGQQARRRQRHELVVRPTRQVAGRSRRRHDGDDGGFTTHDAHENPGPRPGV